MQVKIDSETILSVHVQGQGAPIICLNGFGGYKEIWTAQLERFSRQYQMITFDYRGQGSSTG